ncbi:cell division protein FtsX [Azospirillum halopraeferens]|uniref:cell division protein FtsX n=1 Tax=Azospirillum halopraeferens TaxID=34010 RepID=UPI0003FE66F4|nr:membrane protein [Azospirillum halopraeferens]
MRLLRNRSDLPLARDPSARFLSWITAVMVYLATLAFAGQMMVSDMAERWDSGLAGGVTVQVVPLVGPGASPVAERVETALAILRGTPGVVSATTLPAAETARLIEPWLGADAAADPHLPVPTVIDVVVEPGTDVAALGRRLDAAVPGSSLDDHAAWLADLRAFAGAVELAALAIVALVGGAGVMAVVFAVRTGLAIHRHVVELLHLMGATDRYVARQFESHVLGLCLGGGLAGLGLAAATLAGIHRASAGLRASLLPDFALTAAQWGLLAVVPLIACALAVATARLTVMRTLETMP